MENPGIQRSLRTGTERIQTNKIATQKTKAIATWTLPRNLGVKQGTPNKMQKPGIQRTLCTRTNKTLKTKTIATLTLTKKPRRVPWYCQQYYYEVITLVEIHVL